MEDQEALELAVREVIAETLCCELDDVRPDSQWEADLEGESIGMLELSFRLEKRFGVRVRLDDLDLPQFERDAEDRLTPESLAMLCERYPFMHFEMLAGRSVSRTLDLVTVSGIVGFVQHLLTQSTGNNPASRTASEQDVTRATIQT